MKLLIIILTISSLQSCGGKANKTWAEFELERQMNSYPSGLYYDNRCNRHCDK